MPTWLQFTTAIVGCTNVCHFFRGATFKSWTGRGAADWWLVSYDCEMNERKEDGSYKDGIVGEHCLHVLVPRVASGGLEGAVPWCFSGSFPSN